MNVPNPTPQCSIPNLNPQEAYDELAGEIAAVPDDWRKRIRINVPSAVRTIARAAPGIASLVPACVAMAADPEPLQRIGVYAYATWHAHNLAMAPTVPTSMIEEVADMRKKLLATADHLVEFGIVDEARVARIRRGTGYLDAADDLTTLASLLDEVWPQIEGKLFVTREMVDHAMNLGGQYLLIADDQGLVRTNPAMDTRARAWALLMHKYDHCLRVATYVRWQEGDATTIVPSLHTTKRRGQAAEAIVAEPGEADVPGEPNTGGSQETPKV